VGYNQAMEKYLEFAKKLAKEAEEIALKYFGFENKPINNNKFIDSNLQDTYYLSPQFMTYEQQEKFIKHAQLNNMTLKDMHNYINLVQAKYNHKKISPIYKLTDKELNENEILNSLLPKLTNHH
jgi:hypothetical protein